MYVYVWTGFCLLLDGSPSSIPLVMKPVIRPISIWRQMFLQKLIIIDLMTVTSKYIRFRVRTECSSVIKVPRTLGLFFLSMSSTILSVVLPNGNQTRTECHIISRLPL